MTNERDDDVRDGAPLDGAMLEAARAYNAPPATPRDAMWERIAAARAAAPRREAAGGSTESAGEAPAVHVIPLATRSGRDGRGARRPAWALPLAAALLLGVGIGVGRLSVTRPGESTTPVAVAPAPRAADGPSASTPEQPTTRATQLAGTERPAPGAGNGASSAGSTRPPATGSPPSDESGGTATPLAYRLATAEHLISTETLLATISADARAGRADTSVAAWARDLLGTTRVLMDSPAGRDPKMARLLEDLELVLAQVAQMPAGRGAEELQTIERAVRRRDVMTRVRAAIPTGPLSAGT